MRIFLLPLLLFSVHVVALATAAENRPQVDIVTDKGTIRCTLFADEAPKTVANFIALADGTKEWKDPKTGEKKTAPFYDGLTFHRVIPGFMIQGGCPLGDGRGGPGYSFQDEINARSLGLDKEMVQLQNMQTVSLQQAYESVGYVYNATLPPSHRPLKGMLAMANAGPNTNGSQFFINLEDTPHLTGKHTVFGEVTSGQDIVAAIGAKATTPGGPTVKILRIRSVPAAP